MESSLHTALTNIRQQIDKDEAQSGRASQSVALLAVSKTRSADEIAQLAALGQKDFGENYVDEALEKMQHLKHLDIVWHCIGPLQSNKTKWVASHFDWFHAMDRAKIATRLNQQRQATQAPLNVCIQVNIDAEDSKSGVAPQALDALCEAVTALPNLRLRGLMAIPAPRENAAEQAAVFSALHALYQQYQAKYNLDTLSMGMSQDMSAAIAAGSTMVRVGTALFGARNK